jgi:cytoskeletal protein CcmA (bactofilin family)
MARSPFGGKSEGNGDSFFRPATPAPSAPSPGGLTAFIDQGSEFEGKLSFKDTVRIDGRFRGEISSENTLIVGESGDIEAKIRSRTVAISGNVLGDVTATLKVVVHKTGRIEGNIETESLVIEEGAVINGVIKMGKASAKVKPIDAAPRKPEAMPPKP